MKKKLRSMLSGLLVLAMLLSLLPVGVLAVGTEDAKTPTISVESVTAAPGSEVKVAVSIKDNPGVLGGLLTFSFDDGLTLTAAEAGEAFSALTMTKPGKFTSPCNFVWDGQEISADEIEDGVILTLTFQVAETTATIEKKEIRISCTDDAFVGNDLEILQVNLENGAVTVTSYIPGDLDKNEIVNSKDVIMLRRQLAGGFEQDIYIPAGDVDGNSVLNSKDAILIRRYMAGGYYNSDGTSLELKYSPLAEQADCEHELTETASLAPTCTEPGHNAYWQCSKCGKYFTGSDAITETTPEDEVLPATGHTPDAAGTKCTVCGAQLGISDGEYAITYYLNPTKDAYLATLDIENPNPTKYNSNSATTLKELAVEGYTFEGWYDGAGSSAARITKIAKGETGEVILYARWSKLTYRISYDYSSIQKQEIGQTYTMPYTEYTVDTGVTLPTPSRDRYVFLGWTDDNDQIITRILPGTTGNMTLHANWTSKRNLAVPVKQLEDPIIVEDPGEGKILFAYEIGRLENVPLYKLQDLTSAGGVVTVRKQTVAKSITTTDAETVTKAINAATTDSTAWTLSEDWNETTSLDKEVLEEHGYETETAVELGKTSSNTYTLSTNEYDNTVVNTVDGTTATTTEYDTTTKKERSTWESEANLSVSDKSSEKYTSSVEAGVEVGLGYGPASVKAGMSAKESTEINHETTGEASASTKIQHENTTDKKTGSEKVTVEQDTTATTSDKGWSKSATSSSSVSTNFTQSQKEALSELISEKKSYGTSYANGGSKSDTAAWSTTTGTKEEYTSTFTYTEEETTTTTTEYTINGEEDGCYRLVKAGIVHVFAVVIYDAANNTYSVSTYSVLDDETYDYIDYSATSSPLYDDNENGVLPFEVPYFVSDYVNGRVLYTDGLVISAEGTVSSYNGGNSTVIIPEFWSFSNLDGTNSAVAVRTLNSSAFSGNIDIQNVMLSSYISKIPAGAFKNCTSLKGITGTEITSIGANAFAGCTSLDTFKVASTVKEIGANAFQNAPSITVEASSLEVVQAALASGAKNIKINVSAIADQLNGATLTVPDTVETFELQAGKKTVKDLKIVSSAKTTILNGITITDCTRIPLEISSEKLSLLQVTVSSPSYTLLLSKNVELEVYGTNKLTSANGRAIVCRDLAASYLDQSITPSLEITGNVYHCGNVTGKELLSLTDGEYIAISEAEFSKYIKGTFSVTFDANGGQCSETERMITIGDAIGQLPEATREHYSLAGWYTAAEGGTQVTAGTTIDNASDTTFYAHWTPIPYTVSWSTGTGYQIAVSRTSSPNAGAATGSLSSGATVYYGDVLSVSYTAQTGYSLTSTGKSSITVAGNVTGSDIRAAASPNTYAYTVYCRSSNGTDLGSYSVTNTFGTTNTITPPVKSGYDTPAAQIITWDSTAKTVTFYYTPSWVGSTTKTGTAVSSPKITYSATLQYQNRTASSVQFRVVWTATIEKGGWDAYSQRFNASCSSNSTGAVTIVSVGTWSSSSSSARSATATSGWVTVPVSTTNATSISISIDYYQTNYNGTRMGSDMSDTWTMAIPAY